MGKPRRKNKRAETSSVSGPQGKGSLQQVKKPVKSSGSKRKKKGPSSPGQQEGSIVTRAAKQMEPYENHFQACMNEGSPDEVAGLRDNGGGIGMADLLTVPVKIEEWKGKSEPQGLGNEFSDDDYGGIMVDIPPTVRIKEEPMSDADVNEVVTEEELSDLTMDDVSEDEELSSGSVVNQVGTGSGSCSEDVLFDVPPVKEVEVLDISDSEAPPVRITEGDTMIDVSETVDEEKTSNAAMAVDEANEDTEAAAVASITSLEVFAQALPHVLKQLAKKELLNCRVVRKDWCETVDFYLDSNPVNYPYRHDVTKEKDLRNVWEEDLASSDNLHVTWFPMATTLIDLRKEFDKSQICWYTASRVTLETKNWLCTRFQTVASLSEFRKWFDKSPRNPFVGRLVSLEPETFEAPEFWEEAKGMASSLGSHIWMLIIYTTGYDTEEFYEFYREIQVFLKLVPELKYLEIKHARRCTRDEDADEERDFIVFANQNPLPNLPQLQTLVLPRRLENVLKKVLMQRYGAQVGKIVSDFQKWNYNAASNLSELGIIDVPDFEILSDKVFTPMQAVNLQKLELHFNEQVCVPVDQLFKGLQQYTSLKAVSISFILIPDCYKGESCEGCKECSEYMPATLTRNSEEPLLPMILPSVESFKLATNSPYLTFQFLKSLPQLKYFHLNCAAGHLLGIKEDEEDIGMELKNLVYGGSTQLWKLLPTLKQVKINDWMEYNRPLEMRSKNPWISSFDKVIPHLSGELDDTELLGLISVCPAWKSAVENFIDNQRIETPLTFSSFKQINLARHYRLYDFISTQSIFIRDLEDISFEFETFASKNETDLLWLKSIILEPYYDYSSDLFWNGVEDFLKTFGHLVWFISVKISTEDKLFTYKNLHRCFQNLPNLKSLKIYADFKAETGETARKLSQFMKENPLPTMKYLDTFHFLGNLSLGRTIVNALMLKYSGQLKRLDITPENWSLSYGDLPKLVHLKLKVHDFYTKLPTLFSSLKAPNLQHLELYLSKSIGQQFLFKLLEPFHLRSLRICFTTMETEYVPRSRVMLDPSDTYTLSYSYCKLLSPSDIEEQEYQHHQFDNRIITFPSMEQLDVRLCHDEQSFQFLRSFPSLKYLKFVKTTNARPDDDVGVELMKCENGSEAAKQSEIWDMFPQLKEIQLITNKLTFVDRAGYFYVAKEEYTDNTEDIEEEWI